VCNDEEKNLKNAKFVAAKLQIVSKNMKKNLKRSTLCVQAGWEPKNGESRVLPIVQSTTFKYDNSEEMAMLFDLKKEGYFYTRLQNPTNDAVARKIAALEGGVGAMLTSSGQAANFYAIFNICEAGDHVVTSNEIYGGTFNLFGVTLKKLGIDCTFVSQEASEEEIQAAFRPNTKALFGETISNPGCKVLDIEKFAKIAHKNGVPLIVDNTFATPINCRPFEWGADIVTHSTTKYMDGHATQVGGCVVDSGNFDWMAHADKYPGLCQPDDSYHGLTYATAFGKMAYMTKMVAQLMRDLGSIPAPMNSFLLNLGLETLHVRIPRHCENAMKVAKFLHDDSRVAWVHYSGLEDDENHALAQKYLPNGSCGVMAFGLKGDRDTAIKFMDSLELINIVTHVADARTCVLHPASHTHRQLTDEQLREAGIAPDLIRLSVGIEDVDDIIDDIKQALDKI
jgi:O-acetylhomoserine (thiol)-lyase